MPRRNLALLMVVSVVSLLCYQQVQRNDAGRVLVGAMETIEDRALTEVDRQDLFEAAIEGMVERLDDRHSAYISPKAMQVFNEALDQEFEGVGMEVGLDPKTNQLVVLSPLQGTPAFKAGIRTGDKILRIDGRSTQGTSLKDAVLRMRGRPGESVRLTVLHEGGEQPVEIEIVRAKIQADTVLGDTRRADGSWNFTLEEDPRIGYVRISSFSEHTSDELGRALDGLMAKNVQGLILDLRDNPGGLLKSAVEVADMFISSGVIVTTRDRRERIVDARTAGAKGTYPPIPMAVLINGFTASASEIVAAALQDHGRAVIVGQRTYGKGTVQEVIELEGNRGALKLTTRSYWRPSGRNIHHDQDDPDDADWGVLPDTGYEVALEDDEVAQLRTWRRQRDVNQQPEPASGSDGEPAEPFVDRQLRRAIEYIEGRIEQVGGRME
jgi:carboxyl-terminal processing protease